MTKIVTNWVLVTIWTSIYYVIAFSASLRIRLGTFWRLISKNIQDLTWAPFKLKWSGKFFPFLVPLSDLSKIFFLFSKLRITVSMERLRFLHKRIDLNWIKGSVQPNLSPLLLYVHHLKALSKKKIHRILKFNFLKFRGHNLQKYYYICR